MKDPMITYRGAQARLSELQTQRTEQLQQQQGTRLVQYRGATTNADFHPHHDKKLTTVTYRGATAQMEL